MLSNLKIENIAIIEQASIDFCTGFNCMTGETGAGKSIVIDSINAILGEKTSRELIRSGESKATVSAFFTDISKKTQDILSEMDIPCEDDNTLLINRSMTKDGRNVCKVNGSNVTVSMLKKIGFSLINIHGQSDNQDLMNPDFHYTFIDAVGDVDDLFAQYKQSYYQLLNIKSEINRLTVDDAMKARQIDLLSYQIDELEKADLRIGERDELMSRRKIINNSQKLADSLNTAYSAIADGEDYYGASSLLFDAAKALSTAAEFLDDAKDITESINDIAYTVDSYMSDISNMLENTAFDERELADIEERLDVIYRLSKKYGENEEEMLIFLDKAREELHNITYSDELLANLNNQLIECEKQTSIIAQQLSDKRKLAADFFAEQIQKELSFLDMPETKFSVKFEKTPFTETGTDSIEFLISANRGEAPKPLAKIASGGELSRIMLAIKSVLADKDGTDTLIFDEIDSGVSGRAAGKIALKLYDVSNNRQVICITHLPSIAAFADNHLLISKAVKGEKTYTSVTPLDKNGRVSEIARIIGGNENDRIHLESAELLLSDAQAHKEVI
ncbi:MAG: DNA repair protein RecN [Clostridia bacterium]|nr:DNA repair protein RecN [Clostridia bacterium]